MHKDRINYKRLWEKLIFQFPLNDTKRIEKDATNNYFTVARICCPGNVFTEQLPSNDSTVTNTNLCEEYIKCAVEMDSGAMIYIL
jgi:hypothetical protein